VVQAAFLLAALDAVEAVIRESRFLAWIRTPAGNRHGSTRRRISHLQRGIGGKLRISFNNSA
jgi:hypothetical protein